MRMPRLHWLTLLLFCAACGVRPTPTAAPPPAAATNTARPSPATALPATDTPAAPTPTVAPADDATPLPPLLSHFQYAPKGLFLVVASGELQLLDPATWQVQWSAAPPEGCCTAVAMADDLLAATTVENNVVYVWDTAANTQVLRVTDEAGHFSTLALSPDGQTLGTGEYGAIRLWDLGTGQARLGWDTGDEGVDWFASSAGITDLAFTPDSRSVFSANHYSGQVMAWNAATGAQQAAYGFTDTLAFAFTPGASQLLVEYNDYGFELRDPRTGDLLAQHAQIIGAAGWHTFSADGQRVAVWGYNNDQGHAAAVWELASDTRLQEFATAGFVSPQWNRAALNADGSVIALSDERAIQIEFFDVDSGQKVDEWPRR